MNYHAPSRRTQVQGKDGQIRQIFAEIWKIIKTCFDSIKSLIEAVLQCLGIDWLPNLAGQIGAPSCAACICAGFLGITVALGISLGVGLGVGLHCADKVAVQSNVGIIAMNATASTVQHLQIRTLPLRNSLMAHETFFVEYLKINMIISTKNFNIALLVSIFLVTFAFSIICHV